MAQGLLHKNAPEGSPKSIECDRFVAGRIGTDANDVGRASLKHLLVVRKGFEARELLLKALADLRTHVTGGGQLQAVRVSGGSQTELTTYAAPNHTDCDLRT
jgi:hypothetical protein